MTRTIVITGAGAGIGQATARRFAREGRTVCATDVNEAAVARVLGELAAKHGGSFDVLLNNAGVAFIQNFEEQTLGQHELVTRVNVNGVLNCTYQAFPYLSKATQPTVVNMCSLSSEYGVPSEATYSASKFWVRGFTEAMNIEWERHDIHVCDVMPNFVATPMMADVGGDIVDSVGINLTADDVAETIFKAVADRRRVHWKLDTLKGNLLRGVMNNTPARIHRALMKRVAGY